MHPLGEQLPNMAHPLPAPRGEALVEQLARAECPAFTTRRARREELSGAPHDPIVWAEAVGSNVVDVDGNVYVDLTGGFGAAAIGHRHPALVAALHVQSDVLLHALGDLHPSDIKIALLERLARLGPWPEGRAILSLSGSDAVTSAIKTASVHTGRPGLLAFEGGYHGLGHGPLAACGYSPAFRRPFDAQLNPHVRFAEWPGADADVDHALRHIAQTLDAAPDIGAILLEPIQGRGGVRLPPPGFLAGVGELARSRDVLVIADEILTGLGRAGSMLRSVDDGLTPDLICLGKALGGGLPVSACIGDERVMRAWGDPDGEALHTGTFFGYPLGCAAAMAALDIIEGERLAERARELGSAMTQRLRADLGREVRGAGLLIAVHIGEAERTLALVRRMLERGYLVLPAGSDASALQIAPPLTITEHQLDGFAKTLAEVL